MEAEVEAEVVSRQLIGGVREEIEARRALEVEWQRALSCCKKDSDERARAVVVHRRGASRGAGPTQHMATKSERAIATARSYVHADVLAANVELPHGFKPKVNGLLCCWD